jgi:hypothetical protein
MFILIEWFTYVIIITLLLLLFLRFIAPTAKKHYLSSLYSLTMESATKYYNNTEYKMSLRGGRFMVFNATFNNISVIIVAVSFIGGGNQSTREKTRVFASH